MELLHKIVNGGPIMLVLAAVSVFALAAVVLKSIHLRRLGFKNILSPEELCERAYPSDGSRSNSDDLETVCIAQKQVTKEVLELIRQPNLSAQDRERSIELVINGQIKEMEVGMRAISVIAHLSPLLGLLGTVVGMISSFKALEKVGMKADPSVLAGGIWEALLTTAFGLTIAIPLLAAFHYFESRIDKVADQLPLLVDRLFRCDVCRSAVQPPENREYSVA